MLYEVITRRLATSFHAVGHRLTGGPVHWFHAFFGLDHLPREIPVRGDPVDDCYDGLRFLRWQLDADGRWQRTEIPESREGSVEAFTA